MGFVLVLFSMLGGWLLAMGSIIWHPWPLPHDSWFGVVVMLVGSAVSLGAVILAAWIDTRTTHKGL